METLSIGAPLKDIQNNSRFWSMEIDEFCQRKTNFQTPKIPRKGKGKMKNKTLQLFTTQWDNGKGRGCRQWKGSGDGGKNPGSTKWANRSEESVPPPPAPVASRPRASQFEWAALALMARSSARSTMHSTSVLGSVADPATAQSSCPTASPARRTTGP